MQKSENEQLSVTDQITRYISDHVDNVTLGELSKHFSYHPNYISALIHKETGKTFKQLVLEERMSRAIILMKNTTLSNEEMVIACSNGCHCRTCLRIAIIKRNNCKSVKSDRISEDCFDLFHSVFQRSSTYPHRTKTERRWFKPEVFGGDTQVNLTVIGGSRTLHLMTRKHAQKQEHGSLFPCYIILFCGCVPESMRMHHFTDAVL